MMLDKDEMMGRYKNLRRAIRRERNKVLGWEYSETSEHRRNVENDFQIIKYTGKRVNGFFLCRIICSD